MTGRERTSVFPQKVTTVAHRLSIFQGTPQKQIYQEKYCVIFILYAAAAAASPFFFLTTFAFRDYLERKHFLTSVFEKSLQFVYESANEVVLSQEIPPDAVEIVGLLYLFLDRRRW